MDKQALTVTGYEYIDILTAKNESLQKDHYYHVYCTQEDRLATFNIDGDRVGMLDEEKPIIEKLQELLGNEDLSKMPRLEDASPIIQYIYHEVGNSVNNTYFLENNSEAIADMEEQFHKSWNELTNELNYDINRFGLKDIIDLTNSKDDQSFLLIANDNIRSSFSDENPDFIRNLDGHGATPEEISAGLSTQNAFDMCQIKLEYGIAPEVLNAISLNYEGDLQEVKQGTKKLPDGVYAVEMPADVQSHLNDQKYPETHDLPFFAGNNADGLYWALYMEIKAGEIHRLEKIFSTAMAFDYAHGVFNQENEPAYSNAFFRANQALAVYVYGKELVARCPEITGAIYQDFYAIRCTNTPNLLIDKQFTKQMISRFGMTAGVEKAAYTLQKYSPQAVKNEHYGELVAKKLRDNWANITLEFDWTHFTEANFDSLKKALHEGSYFEEPDTHGYVLVGNLAIDIMSCSDNEILRDDGIMKTETRFDLFTPLATDGPDNISAVDGYPYQFHDEDLGLAAHLPSEAVINSTYDAFVEQVERIVWTAEQAPTKETKALIQAIDRDTMFWQQMEMQQKHSDCKVMFAEDTAYKTVVIIPPGYHDGTISKCIMDCVSDDRPIIMDDKNLVYVVQDCENPVNRVSDDGRYQAFVAVSEFPIESLKGSFHDIIAKGDDFDEVMGKVKEIYPALEEAERRMDKILSQYDSTEYFESSYRNKFITGITADNQDASCIEAVKETMAKTGKSLNQMMVIVNETAPMAVFEPKGKYASKIIKQVKKELAAVKVAAR